MQKSSGDLLRFDLPSFDPVEDIGPDLLFAELVEDFVTHFRVKFCNNILITTGAHKVDGFLKILATNNTRVISASDEENRRSRIPHLPIFWAIGALHEIEERDKTVQSEDEAVALVSVIGGDHGRIADDPGVRAIIVACVKVAVRAGEASRFLVIAAESEIVDEFAMVMFALEKLEEFRNGNSNASARIFAGGATNDEAADVLVILFHVAANDERTHAVTEESERKAGETLLDIFSNLMNVVDNAVHGVLAEIAIITFGVETGTVAAVVVDDDDIALRREIIHEGMVAFAVLGHAVNELDDAFRAFGEVA